MENNDEDGASAEDGASVIHSVIICVACAALLGSFAYVDRGAGHTAGC
jgi:hypothetical protein